MKNLLNCLIFLVLAGCNLSVFVPDPVELRIPRYSEEGYNIAGAFINDVAWKAEAICLFIDCKDPLALSRFRDSLGTSMEFRLKGSMHEGLQQYDDYDLVFRLTNQTIDDLTDLKQLQGQSFSVEDGSMLAYLDTLVFREAYPTINCQKAQFLVRDYREVEDEYGFIKYQISGTFGMECMSGGQPVNVYQGRYDLIVGRISDYVFFD